MHVKILYNFDQLHIFGQDLSARMFNYE